MIAILRVVSALVPSLLLWMYLRSRYLHPQPHRVVWVTFALGGLVLLPILLVPSFARVTANPLSSAIVGALVTGAIPEELLKLLVLTRYSMRRPEFDDPKDGILYGIAVALGFATLENTIYLFLRGGSGAVAVYRAFTGVVGHGSYGAIMGYYVGRAKFARTGARRLIAEGTLIVIALHATYDLPLLFVKRVQKAGPAYASEMPTAMALMTLSLVTLAVAGIAAVRLIQRSRRKQELLARFTKPLPPPDASGGTA